MNQFGLLDEAWKSINSLGGEYDENDQYGIGFNAAIGQALDIIEALGGNDLLVHFLPHEKK